jgi:hypothetical protein
VIKLINAIRDHLALVIRTDGNGGFEIAPQDR